MTTQDQIQAIIATRYDNYTSKHGRMIKVYHDRLRSLEIPLKWYEHLFNFVGGNIKPKKAISDEQFLDLLKNQKIENPRPVYRIPDNFKRV